MTVSELLFQVRYELKTEGCVIKMGGVIKDGIGQGISGDHREFRDS